MIRNNFPGKKRPCSKCGVEITVTEQMCKKGKYTCGKCEYANTKAYRERHREKVRAWNNDYQTRNSANRAHKTRAYRQRYPERKAAHQAVQTALRNGSLIKRPCGVCGSIKSHAHHDSYKRPLDVLWLCHIHHMKRHAMIAESKK